MKADFTEVKQGLSLVGWLVAVAVLCAVVTVAMFIRGSGAAADEASYVVDNLHTVREAVLLFCASSADVANSPTFNMSRFFTPDNMQQVLGSYVNAPTQYDWKNYRVLENPDNGRWYVGFDLSMMPSQSKLKQDLAERSAEEGLLVGSSNEQTLPASPYKASDGVVWLPSP